MIKNRSSWRILDLQLITFIPGLPRCSLLSPILRSIFTNWKRNPAVLGSWSTSLFITCWMILNFPLLTIVGNGKSLFSKLKCKNTPFLFIQIIFTCMQRDRSTQSQELVICKFVISSIEFLLGIFFLLYGRYCF